MTFYTPIYRKATKRAELARGLALAAHPRSRRVFQDPEFQDRAPDETPRRLGDIAAEVVDDIGQVALDRWLRQAARANGEEREAAIEIAREIAGMVGIPWCDVMSGEAA